jgi:hypothetical protein
MEAIGFLVCFAAAEDGQNQAAKRENGRAWMSMKNRYGQQHDVQHDQ